MSINRILACVISLPGTTKVDVGLYSSKLISCPNTEDTAILLVIRKRILYFTKLLRFILYFYYAVRIFFCRLLVCLYPQSGHPRPAQVTFPCIWTSCTLPHDLLSNVLILVLFPF